MSELDRDRSIPRLRCYAEMESDGSWFAICLDLNIYARGVGLCEVRESLNNLVVDYIDEAYGKDRAYVSDLVPRRAPNYFFVRYYYLRVRSLVFGALFSAAKAFLAFALPAIPRSSRTVNA